jgi:hypothetical protein
MTWAGRLLIGVVLTSCAASAPQATASAGPARYAGPVKDLVLPVTEMPSGTRIMTEGPLIAHDLDLAQSAADPGAFEAFLSDHDFIAAHFRTFGAQKRSGAADVECIVMLFSDKSGPRALIPTRGDAMLAYGYRPISVRQTFGDDSRAVSIEGVIKDASGRDTTVTSVRIIYAIANLVVEISIQDDPKIVDPLDAIDLANRQLTYLRLTAPLASPK